MYADATPADRTLRAAVIGSPIGHSKSPLLHSAAYRALGVSCSYAAVDIDERRLEEFLGAVRSDDGWRGLSVTMPLKAGTARLTDTNTDLATALGVVNTVVADGVGPHRVLTGHNTDVVGVANALAGAGVDIPQQPVIIGGGGTAAAAVAGLARLGASTTRVVVRRPEAAADLLRIGSLLGIDVELQAWSQAGAALRSADVVVSTLPPRAGDPLAAALDDGSRTDGFRTDGTLLDVAYDPWPSALGAAWQRAGGSIVPGLDMLLHQAVEQVRLFFPDVVQDRASVLNVMCDAVGAPRR